MNKNDATLIRKILIPDNFVKLDKNLVRVLGIKHAGFLSILIDFDKYIYQNKLYIKRSDGEWFYLSVEEGEDRYMLTKDEQQKLCDDLSNLGIIEFKIFGLPRRKHIKLNYTYILELVTMEEDSIDFIRNNKFIPMLRKRNKGFIGGKNPSSITESIRQPIYSNKEQTYKEINTSPLDKKQDNISLLTSHTVMYESKKTNIELNCTLPINDVTIPVEQKKPKKEVKDPAVMLENRRFSKDFTEAWNAAGKEKLGQIGYVAINKLFAKHGYDKGMFFCHYLCQMQGSNEKSIAKIENQDKAFLFYQDPQEEQPKYLGVTKWDSYKRYKNELEEPNVGSFYNEDSFYAALEYYYSQNYSDTELVKKVRERVKEINCKYKNY